MKNIFLIDDDLNHLAVMAAALSDAGYQIIPKIDAESAIAALGEDIRIDLIVIDYELPALDASSIDDYARIYEQAGQGKRMTTSRRCGTS